MATMMMMQAAGRKRDERGRYMGDDGGRMEMRENRTESARSGGDMRMPTIYPRRAEGSENRRSDREMGGQGWVVWDHDQPDHQEHHPRHDVPHNPYADESRMENRRYGGEARMAYDGGYNNITDMRRYSSLNQGDDGKGTHRQMTQHRQIGFQKSHDALDREDAEEWVRSMKGADGSTGGKWKNINDVKPLAQMVGMAGEQKLPEFYAIINAMYSDYSKVAKKHGVDRPEFYADLAKAWLNDEDAMEGKAALYYECIVRKDKE
jgi:hypothetical protein